MLTKTSIGFFQGSLTRWRKGAFPKLTLGSDLSYTNPPPSMTTRIVQGMGLSEKQYRFPMKGLHFIPHTGTWVWSSCHRAVEKAAAIYSLMLKVKTTSAQHWKATQMKQNVITTDYLTDTESRPPERWGLKRCLGSSGCKAEILTTMSTLVIYWP